jgi:hypothetical protein
MTAQTAHRGMAVLAATAATVACAAWAACKSEPAPAPRAVPVPVATSPAAAPPAAAPPGRAASAPAPGAGHDDAPPCKEIAPPPSRFPAAPRIVAIGDLHGDLAATRRALTLAGAIDAGDRWIGKDLVVVQTGDVLDRGDDEQAILDLLARLAGEAAAAGGAVHALLGNHETMNAAGDFRYVTPGGWADFADAPDVTVDAPALAQELARVSPEFRPRIAAFLPGGPYARRLAQSNAVIMIGDTVFVHGGVLPAWAEYGIERINHELRCWLAGHAPKPVVLDDRDGPLWSRDYSSFVERCDLLQYALENLGARRMVVGHTPQLKGISSACDERVWRIDTGMAAHYGGPTEVLEIRGDTVRVLRRADDVAR